MTRAPIPFDLTGPLPTGINVLEASAGTGKTYAIASLALRYVADGVPLDQLLIVTFTRLATGELRERVRARLVEGMAALDAAARGLPIPDDAVLSAIVREGSHDFAERNDRIRRALAGFDAATISTTHGFCQEILDGLGVAGDADQQIEVTEDLRGIVAEIVDDLYVERFGVSTAHRPDRLSYAVAHRIATAVAMNPDVPIVPDLDDAGRGVAVRVEFAHAVRKEFHARKRRLGLVGYDDLQTRLADTIADPDVGDACRRRLAERYSVVLIDEFQDTDPVQWSILHAGFRGNTVVLIGDPKQAIYAFRGADVITYLEARAVADNLFTLPVNWRSDQGYLTALDALFGGARLGHDDIRVTPVRAAPHHADYGVTNTRNAAPLRLRILRRDHPDAKCIKSGHLAVDWARQTVCDDLAHQVAEMLRDGAHIPTSAGARPVNAGDIGVLTRTNEQASQVRDALIRAGVPAVIFGTGSVFATEAAIDWARLLSALDAPADPSRAGRAALTSFLGWDAQRLANSTDTELSEVHEQLHTWRQILIEGGVTPLMQSLIHSDGRAARILALADGQRHLTDLRHIGGLLHEAMVKEGVGLAALSEWIAHRIDNASIDVDEGSNRRLDADTHAVQVLTVHRSKGLEFGIVCLPFMWNAPVAIRPASEVPVVYDPHTNVRVLDVGGKSGKGFDRRIARLEDDERGEDLRLAYVALTRARHQALVWWADYRDSHKSALSRLVHGIERDPQGPPRRKGVTAGDTFTDAIKAIAAHAPGCITVETVETLPDVAPAPSCGESLPVRLAPARLGRGIDRTWARHSFSGITDGTYEALIASEPETPPRDEDPPNDEDIVRLPTAGLPAGTVFGSLVHDVLESVDFTARDLEGRIGDQVRRLSTQGADSDHALLAKALTAAIQTPLGAALGDISLTGVSLQDRLNELAFELPLVGGDAPVGVVDPAALADVLEAHLLPDDPLAGYPKELAQLADDAGLRGFLVGSIDLVARLPDGRFAVIDYKTNLLGSSRGPIAADYHPDALARQMRRHHYVLQAIIYQVALHRYLRWRVPAYNPSRHLAGAHYLFVRGMTGPDTPTTATGCRYGVFSWTPPPTLVTAMDAVFHRGSPTI